MFFSFVTKHVCLLIFFYYVPSDFQEYVFYHLCFQVEFDALSKNTKHNDLLSLLNCSISTKNYAACSSAASNQDKDQLKSRVDSSDHKMGMG
ncbi:hypothetical protein L1987_00615 [Smallanthus sonchifolius]|uniref:Uncharacterized protein n=1 Tax=Smallanthus sonchifolius TaxID=185202 RepID=A0ACB9K2T9_9ASTR|nr:hypothetical protein L1987_00615 [Smallanthus sonchifolius]